MALQSRIPQIFYGLQVFLRSRRNGGNGRNFLEFDIDDRPVRTALLLVKVDIVMKHF